MLFKHRNHGILELEQTIMWRYKLVWGSNGCVQSHTHQPAHDCLSPQTKDCLATEDLRVVHILDHPKFKGSKPEYPDRMQSPAELNSACSQDKTNEFLLL